MNEPYIKWPLDHLRDEAIQEALAYIKNLKQRKPIITFEGYWTEAVNRLELDGLCLEFGVWKGYSINFFARHLPKRIFYGFDSFYGLKDHWEGGCRGPKWFDEQGHMPEVLPNVRLVKGWFDQTLPKFFNKHKDPIAFMYIDCDTYQAAKDVFDHIDKDRIMKGTLILLDDYMCYYGWRENVYKAFQEWIKKHKLKYEYEMFCKQTALVKII